MARMTVTIDDDVMRRLKGKAAREGRTLQETANDLLKQALTPRHSAKKIKLKLRGWKAKTLSGVDLVDRDGLFDRLDGR
jgi:plasmid stability protein